MNAQVPDPGNAYGSCRDNNSYMFVIGPNAEGRRVHFFVGTNAFGVTIKSVNLNGAIYTIRDFCNGNFINQSMVDRALRDLALLKGEPQRGYPDRTARSVAGPAPKN